MDAALDYLWLTKLPLLLPLGGSSKESLRLPLPSPDKHEHERAFRGWGGGILSAITAWPHGKHVGARSAMESMENVDRSTALFQHCCQYYVATTPRYVTEDEHLSSATRLNKHTIIRVDEP
jgi:hypothetical protein